MANMTPGSSTTPCAGCKFLRRKCLPECVFAPYFAPDQPQKFATVHKVYGASNVSKLLHELPVHLRENAVNSLAYEAEARVQDPVYGCVGIISVLHHKLLYLQQELSLIHSAIASYIGANEETVRAVTIASMEQVPHNQLRQHHLQIPAWSIQGRPAICMEAMSVDEELKSAASMAVTRMHSGVEKESYIMQLPDLALPRDQPQLDTHLTAEQSVEQAVYQEQQGGTTQVIKQSGLFLSKEAAHFTKDTPLQPPFLTKQAGLMHERPAAFIKEELIEDFQVIDNAPILQNTKSTPLETTCLIRQGGISSTAGLVTSKINSCGESTESSLAPSKSMSMVLDFYVGTQLGNPLNYSLSRSRSDSGFGGMSMSTFSNCDLQWQHHISRDS